MSKFAVMLYPNFSLQEISCLTSVLSVWFEEKIDFIASETGSIAARKACVFFLQKQLLMPISPTMTALSCPEPSTLCPRCMMIS